MPLTETNKSGIKNWLAIAFNLPILERQRLAWVDYLRGIAILLVVYRHVLIGIERSGIIVPKEFVTANMVFFSFRIPLFFIVSGLFISASLEKKGLGKLMEKKFETLFYPYLVWAFLQVSLQIVLSGFINSDRSFIDYTYILYQPRSLDQFWYLPALFNATALYLLTKVKLKLSSLAQLILGVTLYFLSPYASEISMISDCMEFYLFFALGDALTQIFFKPSSQKILKDYRALIAVIPVFCLAQIFYLSQEEAYYRDIFTGQAWFLLIVFTGCATMFVLAFRLQSLNILSWLRIIGYHSLYIYVMHVLVAAFVRIVCTHYLGIHEPVILLFTGIFFGLIVPVVFYNLVVKDNAGWFLFSYRKKIVIEQQEKKTPPPVITP